jgi:di/tricarboxylate transporter
VDVAVAALAAAFLMVVSGCLQLKDAYRAIDVKVLLLIVSTLALGAAMEKTGAAELYAGQLIKMLHGLSPVLVLGALILLTCFLTELMSNSATAVLLVPIAISTATALGLNPKPFIMAVCLGASYGFAVPIGYQTHLLIYGPGGYRFTDFLRLGIPMDLMACSISTLLIPIFWPLT